MKNTEKTMVPNNDHKEIPGNPSTAKSSKAKLRKEATTDSLKVLTLAQWEFWKENGYVVVKTQYPKNKLKNCCISLGIRGKGPR